MSTSDASEGRGTFTRRDALKGSGLAALGAAVATAAGRGVSAAATHHDFHGVHQAGVATRVQEHLAFATFDVVNASRGDLVALLATWTAAAAALTQGRSLGPTLNVASPPADTGETAGTSPAALTITFGFGPSLFDERFALASRRPAALADLPAFFGDRLDPWRTGGDLCVQACADDPVVVFHAVRNLARLGAGTVVLRDLQLGSGRTSAPGLRETPRNLLGFKDGTNNVRTDSATEMDEHVWVGDEADQAWMRGGTYLVARRIRVHLEQWAALSLDTQQRAIGRARDSGAPLTGTREHDPLDLAVFDTMGQLVIPDSAHVRVASHQENQGVRILRRGYNFTDGLDPRTGELDAGLMFICFQRDPRRQFVTLQNRLAAHDALSRYLVHTGSGIFACPPGVPRERSIGEELFS